MALVIRNLQRTVNFNISQLHFDISLLRKIARYETFELGIMLVTDEEIQELNKSYRDVDEVTDVLAFPYHEILPEYVGQLPHVDKEEQMLGDIVLGIPYILQESRKNNEDFQSVLLTMVTHGLCHLVGFDHENQTQWKLMRKKELDILNRFNKITGHRCSPLLGVGHYTDT